MDEDDPLVALRNARSRFIADEFLNKPVDLRELLLRIQRVAGRTAAVAERWAPADLLGYPAFVAAARGPISAGLATIALVRVPAGLQPWRRSASKCAAGTLSAATTIPTWCSCFPAWPPSPHATGCATCSDR